MPYRQGDPGLQSLLDEAIALAMEPVAAYAGRIPSVRRVLERVDVGITAAAALAARGEDDAAIGQSLAMVRDVLAVKLAAAERRPDIVVGAPSPSAVVPAPALAADAESRESRARQSPRGLQVRVIEFAVRERRVELARMLVESALAERTAMTLMQRDRLRGAVERLERSLAQVDVLVAAARATPDACDQADVPILAALLASIVMDATELRQIARAGRSFLESAF